MNIINKIFNYLIHNRRLLLISILLKFGGLIPDKLYLQLLFYGYMGKRLNLKKPQTFNEKLQWLKLYDRRPEYTTMVDKYAVKKYVADIIGEEYIIPTLGVWDNFDDIDFNSLPNKFVLKTTHGGGNSGVVICKDKSIFDKKAAKAKLNRSLGQCIYKNFREWPYKNVPKRIIAEKYIEDEAVELRDYKFFCFNGIVKALLITADRRKKGEELKLDFFDNKFNRLPLKQWYPNTSSHIEEPIGFENMKTLASKIAKDIPHARIDFYNINGQIYFGEITFYHFGGLAPFQPHCYDLIFGSWIKLPNQKSI